MAQAHTARDTLDGTRDGTCLILCPDQDTKPCMLLRYMGDRAALQRAVQRPSNAFEAFSRANEEIFTALLSATTGVFLDPTQVQSSDAAQDSCSSQCAGQDLQGSIVTAHACGILLTSSRVCWMPAALPCGMRGLCTGSWAHLCMCNGYLTPCCISG